jgi:hypothetical protein
MKDDVDKFRQRAFISMDADPSGTPLVTKLVSALQSLQTDDFPDSIGDEQLYLNSVN